MTDQQRRAAHSRRQFLQWTVLVAGGGLLAACARPAPAQPGSAAPPPAAPQSGAAAAPAAATSSRSVDKVRLVSWSQPRAEQANFYAAQELGYFRDEGIEYEYVSGQGSGDAVKQILAGNADIAFAGPEGIYFTAEQGGNVMAVYNLYPQNIFVMAAKSSQNIRTPADLRGKTIGVLSLASGGRYNVLTVLAANGMKESDVTLVATGTNPGPFLENKIDVWSSLIPTVNLLAEAENLDITKIYVRDYVNLPTDVLAVTEATLREKPDVIRRFLKAVKRGTEYAQQNVDAAAQLGIKHGLDTKDMKVATAMVQAFNEASVSDETRQHGLGWFDMNLIQRGADFYLESGLIKNKIDTSKYFTNQFVSQL